MASVVEKWNFKFYLILIKLLHMASGYCMGQHTYRA